MDEVDAPLDDANVTRFCNLLEELVKITRTKFIIVTHHALTMSKMDRLYGITMPEKGISQLVAVDLQKAEELFLLLVNEFLLAFFFAILRRVLNSLNFFI